MYNRKKKKKNLYWIFLTRPPAVPPGDKMCIFLVHLYSADLRGALLLYSRRKVSKNERGQHSFVQARFASKNHPCFSRKNNTYKLWKTLLMTSTVRNKQPTKKLVFFFSLTSFFYFETKNFYCVIVLITFRVWKKLYEL